MRFHIIRTENTEEKRSWLEYYKFRPDDEEELYLPVGEDCSHWAAGDIIWILLGDTVYGAAPILRVSEDPINNRLEIWYRGTEIKVLDRPTDLSLLGGELALLNGDVWGSL